LGVLSRLLGVLLRGLWSGKARFWILIGQDFKSFKDLRGCFGGGFGLALGLLWGRLGGALGLLCGCFGGALDLLWGCFQGCSGSCFEVSGRAKLDFGF
jgi:hypothetical protein